MSEEDKLPAAEPNPALEWAKLWQAMAESSNRMVEAWSGSMAPFMLARLSEKPAGLGDTNDRLAVPGAHQCAAPAEIAAADVADPSALPGRFSGDPDHGADYLPDRRHHRSAGLFPLPQI